MAGLHDISPTVAKRCVSSAVDAPSRAAAAAASQPAWPPPTTMTSKCVLMRCSILNPRTDVKSAGAVSRETGKFLFTNAKVPKDRIEDFLDIDAPGEAPHVAGCRPQGLRHEFQLIGGEGRGPQKVLDARRGDLLVTGSDQSGGF